jgi:SnoaL-like domain
MTASTLDTWHRMVRTGDASALPALVAEDAVFYSPVVHSPRQGRDQMVMYLGAAFKVVRNPSFRYVREIVGERDAMLEFETTMDGVQVNGVDIITWNDDGQIIEFKVMIRPLKGINIVHQKMLEALQASTSA